MSRRVWNCPRLELSMKACRVEDTEDRHRGSTALHAMNEKMENKELTINSFPSVHVIVVFNTFNCP